MARYRRVNIDSKSLFKTEPRKLAAATYPGTFAVIDTSDEFAQSAAVTGRMYIIDCGGFHPHSHSRLFCNCGISVNAG